MLVALVVNTSAMHIFKVSSMVLTSMTAIFFFFFFPIFKVTIIKTTSFWFYLKQNLKKPYSSLSHSAALLIPHPSLPLPSSLSRILGPKAIIIDFLENGRN